MRFYSTGYFDFLNAAIASVETRLGIACYKTVGFMCLFII